MSHKPPTLTPEMLLWEIGAVLARHGVGYSTANPSASLHYATQLLRSLGLMMPASAPAPLEAAPEASTAVLPRVPAEEPHLPPGVLAVPLPPRRPVDGHTFTRGRQRPGDPPALCSVPS